MGVDVILRNDNERRWVANGLFGAMMKGWKIHISVPSSSGIRVFGAAQLRRPGGVSSKGYCPFFVYPYLRNGLERAYAGVISTDDYEVFVKDLSDSEKEAMSKAGVLGRGGELFVLWYSDGKGNFFPNRKAPKIAPYVYVDMVRELDKNGLIQSVTGEQLEQAGLKLYA